jgi:hypothetical protein
MHIIFFLFDLIRSSFTSTMPEWDIGVKIHRNLFRFDPNRGIVCLLRHDGCNSKYLLVMLCVYVMCSVNLCSSFVCVVSPLSFEFGSL